MKRFLKFLAYLPVLFLGLIGCIVVADMWHIDLSGRKLSTTIAKNKNETPHATVTPSAGGE